MYNRFCENQQPGTRERVQPYRCGLNNGVCIYEGPLDVNQEGTQASKRTDSKTITLCDFVELIKSKVLVPAKAAL